MFLLLYSNFFSPLLVTLLCFISSSFSVHFYWKTYKKASTSMLSLHINSRTKQLLKKKLLSIIYGLFHQQQESLWTMHQTGYKCQNYKILWKKLSPTYAFFSCFCIKLNRTLSDIKRWGEKTLQQSFTARLMDMKISPHSHIQLRCYCNYQYPFPSLKFPCKQQSELYTISAWN